MPYRGWMSAILLSVSILASAAILLRPATESGDGEVTASEPEARVGESPDHERSGSRASSAPSRITEEDYVHHLSELRKRLPERFDVLVERPFVVIGDDGPDALRRWSQGTIRWAVRQLKRLYFSRDPEQIIDIWLFKDGKSYRANAKQLFGEEPSTPFGYYSSKDRSLVMNIGTGGGTLVHELVHPFIEANFPACPAWFNEGLASLYEQSDEREGRIVGLTNWRLRGLQKAIENGALPSFETLTSTTTRQFYQEDPGTNYGQARYLCYYLQERGLLDKYYHAFVAGQERDPMGFETLKTMLSHDDMERFQRAWEAFVLTLRYRG